MLPLSTIVSGVSFGFIMGCGSLIRSDEGYEGLKQEMRMVTWDKQLGRRVHQERFWESKMLVL
jgi:hypothetical protein